MCPAAWLDVGEAAPLATTQRRERTGVPGETRRARRTTRAPDADRAAAQLMSGVRSVTGTPVWCAHACRVAVSASALPYSTCRPPWRAMRVSSERDARRLRAKERMSTAARSPTQCPTGSRGLFAGARRSGDGRVDRLPQRGDDQVAGCSDRGEQVHALPLDRALDRRLQRLQVRHCLGVAQVNALLGQQRRELAQRLVGHPGPVFNSGRAGRRLWGRAVYVHQGYPEFLPRHPATHKVLAGAFQPDPVNQRGVHNRKPDSRVDKEAPGHTTGQPGRNPDEVPATVKRDLYGHSLGDYR